VELHVPGREVVDDDETRDVLCGLLHRQVGAFTANHGGDLELVVEEPAVRRDRDIVMRTHDRVGIGEVEGRDLPELR
jgi:hypothetical protein